MLSNRLKLIFLDWVRLLTDRLWLNENTAILISASVIGLISGFAVVGYLFLIKLIQTIALGGYDDILTFVAAMPWYKKLFIPSIGGLIVGPLVYYLSREAKGHGVPEVIEAVALRGGRIRSRVLFLKAFASAVTIGTGGSVGSVGPIIQIGSIIGSTFGQWLKSIKERLNILVACGAAAGIAATFNAPIAGVLFSVEVILGNYAITTLVPLIMSSVMATIVGRWYFGDTPIFEIPRYGLESALEIGPYIFLGLITGVVAVGFVKLFYAIEDTADRLPIKNWVKTPIMLLIIGFTLIRFPHVYGVGFETISLVLKGEMIWYMLLLLIPVKMLATSITLAAGASGGIFAPSLFLGAIFGGLYGSLVHFLFPGIAINSGAYAVVGMSAMVAGTIHAPITAFLIIFEMTGDYKLILPLMLCSILASFIASIIMKDSIYTLKLARRGVDLSQGMEVSIMQLTKVKEVMNQNLVVLKESAGYHELLQKVINVRESHYYVVDEEGKYQGSFNVHDVREVSSENSLAGLVVAKDLVSLPIAAAIEIESSLTECMRKFSQYETGEIPVVDHRASNRLVGKVGRRDIINFYNREILSQGSLGLKFIQSKIPETALTQSCVDLPDEYEINVLPVTVALQERTLKELDIRNNFGVTIVAINRHGDIGIREVIIPHPEEILNRDDMLVVLGKKDDLKKLKSAYDLPI